MSDSFRNGDEAIDAERAARVIEGVLANLPMFRHVARDHVAMVARHSCTLSLRPGAQICARGALPPGVFALAYGSAKLALTRGDGGESVIRFLHAGESFGEASALHERPSPVEVTTLEETLAIVMPKLTLLALLEKDHRFARNLIRILAEQFFDVLAELDARIHLSAIERLCRYLILLARAQGGEENRQIRLPTSKSGVAARLGITKETMSRLLADLVRRRLIAGAGRDIEILNLRALSEVVA